MFEFELEHVTAIASASRSEVFWAFDKDEPLSTKQVAAGLGKSAQTVRYHVNELVAIGLLLPVEVRKSRSRTEEAYVQSAFEFRAKAPPVSQEYQEQMIRGFDSILRQMSRERAEMVRLMNVDPDLIRYLGYRRYTIRVNPDNAKELRRRLVQLAEDARELETKEGVRVHYTVYMSATASESQKFKKALFPNQKKKPKAK